MTGSADHRNFVHHARKIVSEQVGRPDGLVAGVAGALVLALALRILFVTIQSRFQVFDAPFVASDSHLYLDLASSVLAGNGLAIEGRATAFVGPTYPIFIAILAGVGLDAFGIGIVQAFIGAATVAVLGMAAAELAHLVSLERGAARATVLMTSIGAAVYPHFIFWTGYILTETLFTFLVGLALLATLRAMRTSDPAWATTAGVVSAIAILARPAYLACALLIAVGWAVRWRPRAGGSRRSVALFLGALVLVQSPWVLRNWVALGEPVATVTQGGLTLYQGNARGSSGGAGGYGDHTALDELVVPEGLSETQRDSFYMRAAFEEMRMDPLAVIRRWPAKLWNMWRPTYEGASLRNGLVFGLSYLPVIVLGLIGLAVLARASPRTGAELPLYLFAVWAVSHMLLIGLIRYRVPAETYLLVALPFGASAIWRYCHRPVTPG